MIATVYVFWSIATLLWLILSFGLCYAIWWLKRELDAVVHGLSLLGREHEAHQQWTGILSTRLTHMDQAPRESTPSLFRMGGTLYSIPDPRRHHRSSSISLPSESSPPARPLFRIGSVVSNWSHQFSTASRSPIHWESAVSLAEREIRQRQHQPSSLSLACAPPQAHLIPRYCPLGLEIPPPSAEWLASQNPPPSAEWIAAQGLLSLARSGPRQSPSPAPQV